MKKLLAILFFGSLNLGLHAQGYIDNIVNQACDCVGEIEEQANDDSFNMKLGLCILEAAGDYEEELLRDYEVDFNYIERDGEKLGRIIGVKMVGVCPKVFEMIAEVQQVENEPEVISNTGVVSKVEKGTFVIIHLNEDGQTKKYYWITEVDSNFDLTQEFENLVDKTVDISSQSIVVFDPRIQEYRSVNMILSLNLLE